MFDPEEASAVFPVLGAHDVEQAVEGPPLDTAVEHVKELGPDLDLRAPQATQERRLQFRRQLRRTQCLVPAREGVMEKPNL